MNVAFRNVDFDPGAPVEQWPYEAIVTTIERGRIGDWAVLTRTISTDPWGPVARQVEEFLSYERPYGAAPLLERAIYRARRAAQDHEREAVAREVADLVERSGLTLGACAERLGTSASRLSTYRSGKVMPAAGLLVRLRELVNRLATDGSAGAVERRPAGRTFGDGLGVRERQSEKGAPRGTTQRSGPTA